MACILKTVLLLFILKFVKTQASNFKCVTNEVNDFYKITELKITSRNFENLDQLLKDRLNKTIDLILNWLDLPYLKDVKLNNSHISKLDLSNNNIKSIPEDFFSRLKFIKEIILRENSISDLTNFYRNIEKKLCAFIYLETLDLSSNKISSVDGNNFDKLKNLKVLYLHRNQIKILSIDDFNKFNQIKELRLGNEGMIFDEDLSFKKFSNLDLLDLSYCKFKPLNSNLFAGLKNLTNLDLFEIKLINVTENIFFEFKNLKKLSLLSVVENKEQFLNIFSFIPAQYNLEHLDISGNNLISLDGLNLNQFSKLRILYLTDNKLSDLSQICFYCMTHLTEIFLWRNNISKIPNFDKNLNLEYIGLYNNNIQTIHTKAFYNLPKLETIDFEGNPIKLIEPNAFYYCTNLKVIWLPTNKLTKDILFNLIKTLNNIIVKNAIDVKYFKSIHVINTDEFDERFCISLIYFLRYQVTFITKESFYNVPLEVNEDKSIYIKRVFYYSEELTVQYFMNNCLNFSITQSDKFEILDKFQFSDSR